MKKLLVFVVITLLVFVCLIAGCSGSKSDNTPPVSQNTPTQSGAAPSTDTTQNGTAVFPGNNASAGAESNQVTDDEPVLDLPLIIENYTLDGVHFILENGDAVIYQEDYSQFVLGSPVPLVAITVLSDVRSVYSSAQSHYFIRTDNSLWAYGKNDYGQLGDNTGVDKSEPVKIMDNVANLYLCGRTGNPVYAVTNDRILWRWGLQNHFLSSATYVEYAPVAILDDVVILCTDGYAIKSDGSLWTWDEFYYFNGTPFSSPMDVLSGDENPEPIKVMGNVLSFRKSGTVDAAYYVLKGDCSLWTWSSVRNTNASTGFVTWEETEFHKIMDDVKFIDLLGADTTRVTIVVIKNDDTYWGFGDNSRGLLGDGTKINRDEPVMVMDGVSRMFEYAILKTDGSLWRWNDMDPTPQLAFDNVAAYYQRAFETYILEQNGSLYRVFSLISPPEHLDDGVRLPSTIVID